MFAAAALFGFALVWLLCWCGMCSVKTQLRAARRCILRAVGAAFEFAARKAAGSHAFVHVTCVTLSTLCGHVCDPQVTSHSCCGSDITDWFILFFLFIT
jgi:hypothetical protein